MIKVLVVVPKDIVVEIKEGMESKEVLLVKEEGVKVKDFVDAQEEICGG